jgi:hypothetical protein
MGILGAQDKKTRSITVAARPSDPKMFRAQKGNKVIYLRSTAPEPKGLTPLAAFLVENVDSCVVCELNGQPARRVLLYSGRTEAEILRERKPGRHTETIISSHGLDRELAQMGEWQFLVMEPQQSDAEYWNAEADRLLLTGARSIVIGQAKMVL